MKTSAKHRLSQKNRNQHVHRGGRLLPRWNGVAGGAGPFQAYAEFINHRLLCYLVFLCAALKGLVEFLPTSVQQDASFNLG